MPKLTLAEVALQIANAKAVVSVDTGLSHLTAALDKPNFTLFGPTDPGLIGGYGLEQHEIKSVDGTMSSIKPMAIFSQLKEHL
ncbi:Lipopolysaccharide heptosyltransferase 1 [Providencia stuartii]|nr:Lipopolysaccharide heptosyltransferase 1 [Providencia stuartii]